MLISAIVITKNEQNDSLKRCLKSLDFVDEIILIVDNDKVQNLYKISNLKIMKNSLNDDFASQRNFAMKEAKGDWLLFLDDDEELSQELKKEIIEKLNNNNNKTIASYYIKRRDFFWGGEVKFGELKKTRTKGIIRLVKKNSGLWKGKVHEEFFLKNKKLKTSSFKNFINHFPHQTLKEFIADINYYSRLRALELYEKGVRTNLFQIIFYPFFKFVLTYFIYLGFLDGAAGFVYSFMMSFHSFLVRAKLYLLNKNL